MHFTEVLIKIDCNYWQCSAEGDAASPMNIIAIAIALSLSLSLSLSIEREERERWDR